MTIKECLYRELKYGGFLDGLIDSGNVKLNRRLSPPSDRSESAYPFLAFRRVTAEEDNQVRFGREQFAFAVVGQRSSPSKGDALLEQVKDALLTHFKGKVTTFGAYSADGTPDPGGGLKLRAEFIDARDDFWSDLSEKAQILTFAFAYVRGQG